MKHVLLVLCLLPLLGAAQICTIDFSETVPGIYPDTMPQGTVNQYYDEDITFVMPLDTQGFDFTNFHILSISLPVGLSWECNNSASNCDYNPQVNPYGCVNVYGTPLLAGQYNVDVTVIADLTIVSGVSTSFSVFLEILPNTVVTTNTGFSMAGSTGCSPQTVSFTNNNPGLLAYAWDFGNGSTSTVENPAPQIYNAPGDYVVSYEAWDALDTLHVYTLNFVEITSMSNYGEGFPSFELADPYYILYENGSVFSQSGIIGNTDPPVSWTTNVLLNPANSYSIQVWDSDAGEILFGADDLMGSATVNLNGCTGCAAGTSVINYSINHQIIYPTPSVISVDTVHVNGYPTPPIVTWDSLSHTLSTVDLGNSYQWYHNASPISGATDTTHLVMISGYYHLVAINGNGCVSFSDTTLAIFCDPAYIPIVQVNGDGNLIVTNANGNDVQWYFNGTPLANDTLEICVPAVAGNYSVQLTDEFGCTTSSSPQNVNVGLDDLEKFSWSVYPNPAQNEVQVSIDAGVDVDRIEIVDLSGRVLVTMRAPVDLTTKIDVSAMSNGSYILRVSANNGVSTKSVIIHKM